MTTTATLTGREQGTVTDWFNIIAMFLFSCLTGLRIGDVLTLKWKHIDRSDEPWVINKILEKKVGGNKVRIENIISSYCCEVVKILKCFFFFFWSMHWFLTI